MIIGFDLDNTIFDYSDAIALAAKEMFGVSFDDNVMRESAKSYIKKSFGESEWTRLQGLLYTRYVVNAKIDMCALNLIKEITESGHHYVEIVSHKTLYPIVGPKVDMRSVATQHFYESINKLSEKPLHIPIKFTETLDEKIKYINSYPFDIFVDDLLEVINQLRIKYRIWFRPSTINTQEFFLANNWSDVDSHIKNLLSC